MLRKKLFYLISALNISLLIFSPFGAKADLIDMDPDEIFEDIVYGEMGVDEATLHSSVASYNVSERKRQNPQVTVTFNPANPTPGQKVTAIAQPKYFLNDASKLYYTWYIRHAEGKNTKDHNGDGRSGENISTRWKLEDYKVEAARILASNDFESNADGAYDQHTDDDAYLVAWGGDDQRGKPASCIYQNIKNGRQFAVQCIHVSPYDYKLMDDGSICVEGDYDCDFQIDRPAEIGNNQKPTWRTVGQVELFGKNRERFWHTDPNNSDTKESGRPDEANVVGLGANEFTWYYQAGDEVGVAVEGVSAMDATQAYNAGYKTMWALSKNNFTNCKPTNCDARDDTSIPDCPAGECAAYDSEGNCGIHTNRINVCLMDNFVNPAEEGQAKSLDISLINTPESPNNDPTGEMADELYVQSSVMNSENLQNVRYTWNIWTSDETDPNSDAWQELIKTVNPGAFISKTSGLGVSDLRLKMVFNNLKKYLKIRVQAEEELTNSLTVDGKSFIRKGHAIIVIPVSAITKTIDVYTVKGTDSAADGLPLSQGREICGKGAGTDKVHNIICPIARNEIIMLKAPATIDLQTPPIIRQRRGLGGQSRITTVGIKDIHWTIDGNVFAYPEVDCAKQLGVCSGAVGENTNIAYFPVMKDIGETYTVTFSGVPEGSLNADRVTLTRTFKVIDPEIKIVSKDESTSAPLLLGMFVDLEGQETLDKSPNDFVAATDETIKLGKEVLGPALDSYTWYIDGIEMMPENLPAFSATIDANGDLSFPAQKVATENYTVSIKSLYTQGLGIKQFLKEYYNVPLNSFYEKTLGSTINITMVDSLAANKMADSDGGQKILANLSGNLPGYIAFLFRIVITAFLLLFVSRLALAFSPRAQEK